MVGVTLKVLPTLLPGKLLFYIGYLLLGNMVTASDHIVIRCMYAHAHMRP